MELVKRVEALEHKYGDLHRVVNMNDKSRDQLFEEQIDFRENVSKRFTEVDRRLDKIDKRFDQVDKRFEQVDKRFDQMDRRFDQLELLIRQYLPKA